MPQRLLATMVTSTTYGTWLPGDLRGYVDGGVILPGDPALLERARHRMIHEPVLLVPSEQDAACAALCDAAIEFGYDLIAVSLESWHVHFVLNHRYDPIDAVVGRLKTRMRQAADRGRIWTEGYDKRFCYTEQQVWTRVAYVNRHHGARGVKTPGRAGG